MQLIKTKNHGQHRDFHIDQDNSLEKSCLAGLYQGAHALGTQHLTYFAPLLVDRNRLQVRFKSPAGGFLRPGTVATKGRLLPAMLTLCHKRSSFLDRSSLHGPPGGRLLERAEKSYHSSYLISSSAV